ncbi:MAG: hypothetical protein NT167_15090 [Verrucomicrobia bacterium]|nr:hypothetical protein [Verrucomicrobiota bacterium]
MAGGFWGILAVVQTNNAPLLSIALAATNTIVVWWPSPSTGWSLQQISNLETTNWAAPPETVNDNGTSKFILIAPPTGNRFCRLFHSNSHYGPVTPRRVPSPGVPIASIMRTAGCSRHCIDARAARDRIGV